MPADPAGELLRQGPIETQLGALAIERLLGRERAAASVLEFDNVARGHAQQKKYQQRNAKQCRNHQQQTL